MSAHGQDGGRELEVARQIVATVREPVLVLDPELRVSFANAAFYDRFKVSPERTQRRTVYELGNGQWNIPRLHELLNQVLAADQSFDDYELDHDFEDLGRRTMLLNARRIAAADLILLAIEDITERKLAEEARERAAEQAQKTIDTVREPMLVLGDDLRVQSANASFYSTFRVSAAETEGTPVFALGNGQWDIPGLHELLENVLPDDNAFNGYLIEHEFEAIGRRSMLLNARRIDHVQLILLAIEDVTERQRAEEELRRSARRLAAIVEQLPVGLGVVDSKGTFEVSNAIMREYTGAVLPSVDEEQRSRWQALDERGEVIPADEWPGAKALRGETTTPGVELLYTDANGKQHWTMASAAPLEDGGNEPPGAIVVLQDVTRLKHAEQELREANRLKDELLGMVSHEFRTPLTVISGNIDILTNRMAELSTELRSQVFADLRTERDRLHRLVDNMLLLARDGSGQHPEMEPLHLQRILERVVATEQRRDTSRQVLLSVSDDLRVALGSEGYVEQVLENLLTNARKYAYPGTPIEIAAYPEDGSARVVVRDQGDVLDAGDVAQFLEPFYRRDRQAHSLSGAGLGLAVCGRLLAAMGGSIAAEPRAGGGLQVSFTIPLVADEPEPDSR